MSDITPSRQLRQRIVIDKTSGGHSGTDLQQCYFLPAAVDGVYNLYNKNDKILAANMVSGQDFNFTVDRIHFHIHGFEINELRAQGDWKNNAPVPVDEQEGTFQAQVGGGAEVAAGVSSFTAPTDAIVIDSVTGGNDKDKLKHCYFLPDGDEYDLYSKHGTELASGLTSGTDFDFRHDSIEWTVTDFVISNSAASGNWANPDNRTAEQDGTFQAQVGGGADTEASASAATA